MGSEVKVGRCGKGEEKALREGGNGDKEERKYEALPQAH